MEKTVFRVKNHAARSIGLAGKLCIAGAGCTTPPALKDTTFQFSPALELSEEDMFKSWRGLLASMKAVTAANRPELEVFAEGVKTPLTEEQILTWVAEYRAKKNLPEPTTVREHAKEAEVAMNRPEDWIERNAREEKEATRKAQEARDAKMISTVVESVLKVLDERQRQAKDVPPVRADPRK